MIHCKEGLGS